MTSEYLVYKGLYITLESPQAGQINVTKSNSRIIFDYPCSTSTTCTPYIIKFPRGFYKFELYGASGGDATYSEKYKGGCGGLSTGELRAYIPTSLFLYLGGKGGEYPNQFSPPGGYNGGGTAYGYAGGGGGGTDIRTIGKNIASNDSIESRILVAGGGGGARSEANFVSDGGDGGGLNGEQGNHSSENNVPCYGTINGCIDGKGAHSIGEKWQGGSGNTDWGSFSGGAGGGGGYYGGGTCADCSGSGGSGYFKEPIFNGKTVFNNHVGHGKAIIYVFNSLCSYISHHYFSYTTIFMLLVYNKS